MFAERLKCNLKPQGFITTLEQLKFKTDATQCRTIGISPTLLVGVQNGSTAVESYLSVSYKVKHTHAF